MSDPFASHPTALDGAARFSTPPLSPPQSFQPPASAHQATSSGTRPHTQPAPAPSVPAPTGLRTPAASPPPDEFGAYSSIPPGTSQSTSAARPKPTHSDTMPLPLPVPEPVASSSSSQTPPQPPTNRSRQRQSHNPSAALANASPPKVEHLTDEYVLHPSVWAYKQAHPRRPMVGFGPYVLLQTLGEGEFGKVKLGVHTEYGVEVAIKLIRRGSLDDEVRANKVEREIDVLKTLKHPNIVRMFDVIDTEKYIGIVLEFAGGGELFDYILANRYLKERDAQKLFAQLISGVDYLHKKHIVHRDLKLENLLLDKHRNVIITDFGFANRFNHAADDLMATSCGSPCYAAPELVVSEGLYVGSAVDIWSCGVILYAMLSGYLPYDDDPDNPEGDNINLLYKYIMSTSLKFPDHLSALAKDLLQMMLVPEPEYRCSINQIMEHPWLYSQRDVFERTIEMNEYVFQENMYRKSQQAKRDLQERRRVQQEAKAAKVSIQRSQSSMPGSSVTAGMLDARRAQRHHSALPTTSTMPEFLANAGRGPPLGQPAPSAPAPAQTSPVFARAAITWEIVTPPRIDTNAVAEVRAPSPNSPAYKPSFERAASAAAVENDPQVEATAERPTMQQNKNRHTIQVEYDGEAAYERIHEVYDARDEDANADRRPSKKRTLHVPQATTSDIEMASGSESGHARASTMESLALDATTPEASQILTPDETTVSLPPGAAPAKPVSADSQADTPLTPRASNPAIREDILATPRAQVTPTATPKASLRAQGKRFDSMPPPAVPPPKAVPELAEPPRSAGLTPLGLPKVLPPKRDRARKGMSLDKFGLAKLLGQTPASSSVDVSRPPPSAGVAAAALQEAQAGPRESRETKRSSMIRPRTAESENKDKKSSRRRTLQLITSRDRSTGSSKPATPLSSTTSSTPAPLSARDMNPATPSVSQTSPPLVIDSGGIQPQPTDRGQSSPSIVTVDAFAAQQASGTSKTGASSNAAKKVMDWFRRKSLAKDTLVTLKTAGLRSDSASSFVRVEESPARLAPVRDHVEVDSVSSIAPTAEGPLTDGPSITVTTPVPGDATEEGESRIPLGSASNKVNIPVSASASATAESLPVPSSHKSNNLPTPTQVPLSTTSTISAHPSRPAVAQATPRSPPRGDESKMRVHTGLVDQSALSSKTPNDVMAEVIKVLLEMGMEVKRENEYRLRCTRRHVGRERHESIYVDEQRLGESDRLARSSDAPVPSGLLSGGGLKGMLLRRGSSYAAQLSRSESESQSISAGLASPTASSVGLSPATPGSPTLHAPLYGEHSCQTPSSARSLAHECSVDNGDEVKFNVELCRIKNLPGLYLLNIKRLRGSVWSFKFIYQTVIERCETLTH
ncbi:hypothetical protein EHS25_004197 [Saitozyma podzolica]|uniref:non-specific serine/threonine protein kinase n=1 Tax=Saitozyma podzolica TaxID=1890683 RepID=A0A427YTD9_9TREE|nr:hypothetical protein EHS25_004197 [Saitozyma podzolica]